MLNATVTATVYYLDWHSPEAAGRDSDMFIRFMEIQMGHDQPTMTEVSTPEMKQYVEVGAMEVPAFDFDDDVPTAVLEGIYRDLQNGVGRGTENVFGRPLRSMSMGDVVKLGGRYYVVAAVGWKSLAHQRATGEDQ